jgi:hypothetical protein
MLFGVLTFAGAVVYAAIQMPEAPPEALRPAVACLLEWNCIGPMEFYHVPPGPIYALYMCDHGYVFLRQPDLEA